jgi:hypothetical protein
MTADLLRGFRNAGSGQDAESDRQVEGGAFLAEVGGGEVDESPVNSRRVVAIRS